MEKEKIRVLLVEDNAGDARLVQEFLAEADLVHFEIVWIQRLDECTKHIEEGGFDVVLLDLGLADISGQDTLDNMYFLSGDTPIVVLTGQADEALAISAVQVGAQDYLYKGGMNGDLLTRALRYAVERHRQQTALDEIKEMLLQAEAVEKAGRQIKEPLGVISKLANQLLQEASESHPQHSRLSSLYDAAQQIEAVLDRMSALGSYVVDSTAPQGQEQLSDR